MAQPQGKSGPGQIPEGALPGCSRGGDTVPSRGHPKCHLPSAEFLGSSLSFGDCGGLGTGSSSLLSGLSSLCAGCNAQARSFHPLQCKQNKTKKKKKEGKERVEKKEEKRKEKEKIKDKENKGKGKKKIKKQKYNN